MTKAHIIITFKGGRLQPGDALDAARPTCVRHQPHAGTTDEPDKWTKIQSPGRSIGRPFIAKGHVTGARVAMCLHLLAHSSHPPREESQRKRDERKAVEALDAQESTDLETDVYAQDSYDESEKEKEDKSPPCPKKA